MDEKQLRIILEAQNNARAVVRGLMDDLQSLERQAEKTNAALRFDASASGGGGGGRSGGGKGRSGGGGEADENAKFAAYLKTRVKLNQEYLNQTRKQEEERVAQAKRFQTEFEELERKKTHQRTLLLRKRLDEEAKAERQAEADRLAQAKRLQAEFEALERKKSRDRVLLLRKREADEAQERARAKAQALKDAVSQAEAERSAAQKAHRDAERELQKHLQTMAREHEQAARELRQQEEAAERAAAASAQRQAQRRSMGSQGVGQLLSGGANVLGGIGGLAGDVMGLAGTLGNIAGMAARAAGSVVSMVGGAVSEVARRGEVALGVVTALAAATAHLGLEFNQLRQNSRYSLEVLTGSVEKAKKIFDYSMKLSFPAKFPFTEVLQAAQSLESFGLKLDKYGQSTGRYLRAAVSLAQGVGKPLDQAVRLFSAANQGMLLQRQAAPMGINRALLAHYGAEFNSHGQSTSTRKLVEAMTRAVEDRWGDALKRMENTYEARLDSMVSMSKMFAGRITEGLFDRLGKAFKNVADTFDHLMNSRDPKIRAFVDGLAAPFTLFGAALEQATRHLPEFVRWLAAIVNEQSVVNTLADVLSLVQAIGRDLLHLISSASGGRSMTQMWEDFKRAAGDAINNVVKGWQYFMGWVDYLLKNGPMLWQGIVSGAQKLVDVLKIMVGLWALNFGASVAGNILRVLSGLKDLGAGVLKLTGYLRGLRAAGDAGDATAAAARGFSRPGGAAAVAPAAGRAGGVAGALRSPLLWIPAAAAAAAYGANEVMDARRGVKSPGIMATIQNLLPWTRHDGIAADQKHLDFHRRAVAAARSAGGWHPPTPGMGLPQPGSGLTGPLAGVRDLGDWTLRMGGAAAGGMVPPEMASFFRNGDAHARAGVTGIPGYAPAFQGDFQRNRDFLMGLLHPERRRRGGGGPDIPPSEILGQSGRGAGGGTIEPRSEAVLDQLIQAEEYRMRGSGRDERPGEKLRVLMPLLQEKAADQRKRVQEADLSIRMKQAEAARDPKEFFDPNGPEVLEKMKAISALAKTEAEMETMRREAAESARKHLAEADEARLAMVKAQVEAYPESQRHQAAVRLLVPELKKKAADILQSLQQTKKGTKEAYELEQRYYETQRQIEDLRARSAEESAKQAFERPRRQYQTLRKLIGMMPKGAQGAAMRALLVPRLMQTFQAAESEPDPIRRQEKLLEAADMFSELKQSKGNDPFERFFDRSLNGQRNLAIQAYRQQMLRRGARGPSRRDERSVAALESPFALSPGGFGGRGGLIGGSRATQIILNLPRNANEDQIANAIRSLLREEFGREGF